MYGSAPVPHEDIVKAIDLKIGDTSDVMDLRLPIRPGDFAEKAASLVAYTVTMDLKTGAQTYTRADLT
jgi:hypothetical protein